MPSVSSGTAPRRTQSVSCGAGRALLRRGPDAVTRTGFQSFLSNRQMVNQEGLRWGVGLHEMPRLLTPIVPLDLAVGSWEDGSHHLSLVLYNGGDRTGPCSCQSFIKLDVSLVINTRDCF